MREENKAVQVTTIKNTRDNVIKVIDHKPIPVVENKPVTCPLTFVNVIPAPLIATTATQITEIG
jgi:hypothetical protein